MTGKELKEMVAQVPDDVEVGIWMWFADGERIYLPNKPLNGLTFRTDKLRGRVAIVGTCDDCSGHRLKAPIPVLDETSPPKTGRCDLSANGACEATETECEHAGQHPMFKERCGTDCCGRECRCVAQGEE